MEKKPKKLDHPRKKPKKPSEYEQILDELITTRAILAKVHGLLVEVLEKIKEESDE